MKKWYFMKGLESGKDKVKKICDVLRKETIDPAKQEAEQIIQKAHRDAERVLSDARKEAQHMQAEARKEIEKQKAIFQAALNQTCKQTLESLKQNIEEKLFNEQLSQLIASYSNDPQIVAKLIDAIIRAIEKEGIDADLSVYISAAVPARSINALLAKEIIEKLKEKSVLVGPFPGGIEVKLHRENITIDMTEAALKELLAKYIRKDFRQMLFGSI